MTHFQTPVSQQITHFQTPVSQQITHFQTPVSQQRLTSKLELWSTNNSLLNSISSFEI